MWTERCFLTRSSIGHLHVHSVVLLLQIPDVALLVDQEVGDRCLTHNQHAGQQGESCHRVGPGGPLAEKRHKEERKGIFLFCY